MHFVEFPSPHLLVFARHDVKILLLGGNQDQLRDLALVKFDSCNTTPAKFALVVDFSVNNRYFRLAHLDQGIDFLLWNDS